MRIDVNDIVALPAFAPYPRYGRLVRCEGDTTHVTDVHCGDPRCLAEHQHSDQAWRAEELESAAAYQPRAAWESGRKSAPNAIVR